MTWVIVDTSSDQDQKGADVKFPPPLIFLGAILPGYAMHYIFPLNPGEGIEIMIAGLTMVLMALVITIVACLGIMPGQELDTA